MITSVNASLNCLLIIDNLTFCIFWVEIWFAKNLSDIEIFLSCVYVYSRLLGIYFDLNHRSYDSNSKLFQKLVTYIDIEVDVTFEFS